MSLNLYLPHVLADILVFCTPIAKLSFQSKNDTNNFYSFASYGRIKEIGEPSEKTVPPNVNSTDRVLSVQSIHWH